MSVYINDRMNATIAVINTKLHNLFFEMCMIELREAENIDFSLQNALIRLSDAADMALEDIQRVERGLERAKELKIATLKRIEAEDKKTEALEQNRTDESSNQDYNEK